MNRLTCLSLVTLACAASLAAAPQSPKLLRDAVSPVVTLAPGAGTVLSGRADGEAVKGRLILGKDGTLDQLTLSENGRELDFAASALSGLSGVSRAWLEERGALTTMVVKGTSDGKDWRLALAFHDRQL